MLERERWKRDQELSLGQERAFIKMLDLLHSLYAFEEGTEGLGGNTSSGSGVCVCVCVCALNFMACEPGRVTSSPLAAPRSRV